MEGGKKNILVIGAGVIGLSSAVQIKEFYGDRAEVTIVSEKFSPDTTGDGSAGLWGPYLCNTDKNVLKWADLTHEFFFTLWKNGFAGEAGVCLQPMIRAIDDDNYEIPPWVNIPYGCHVLSKDSLDRINQEYNKKFKGGVQFVSFTCEPVRLLPYLEKRFQAAGGIIKQGKITKIQDVKNYGDFDLVVNCAGLGAKEFCNDEDLNAVRGQVTRVKAPWMFQTILDDADDGNYIITNSESVVLGGTHTYKDYNLNISETDHEFIMKGCQYFIPTLKHAPIIKRWAGLRPGRPSIRFEPESMIDESGKKLTIIHNYGHGGSGVCLSWGCGTSALDMVKDHLGTELKSKL